MQTIANSGNDWIPNKFYQRGFILRSHAAPIPQFKSKTIEKHLVVTIDKP